MTKMVSLPKETEWVEFKCNNNDPEEIGKRLSAMGNGTCLPMERFKIEDHNYSIASRIIADTIDAGLVKSYDPENLSKKHARYIPIWA